MTPKPTAAARASAREACAHTRFSLASAADRRAAAEPGCSTGTTASVSANLRTGGPVGIHTGSPARRPADPEVHFPLRAACTDRSEAWAHLRRTARQADHDPARAGRTRPEDRPTGGCPT